MLIGYVYRSICHDIRRIGFLPRGSLCRLAATAPPFSLNLIPPPTLPYPDYPRCIAGREYLPTSPVFSSPRGTRDQRATALAKSSLRAIICRAMRRAATAITTLHTVPTSARGVGSPTESRSCLSDAGFMQPRSPVP